MKSIIEKITARLRTIPADAVGFVPVPIEDVRALQDCCEDFYEPDPLDRHPCGGVVLDDQSKTATRRKRG